MSEPFVGEVRYFGCNFAPEGWAFCDGAILSIEENQMLFALIGTQYGGDGQRTFAVPDLRGSVAMHQGTGVDLPARAIGGQSTLQSAPDQGDSNRAMGTLVLNACIALYGIFPDRE